MQVLPAEKAGQDLEGGRVGVGVRDGPIGPGDIVHRKWKVVVDRLECRLSGQFLEKEMNGEV